ncbi:hypothetical protein L204_105740 [Cryptococcus depauperatus]|nr:hypothetical protein L204_06447 [Cryptococcus depauperatus CBS 7855]
MQSALPPASSHTEHPHDISLQQSLVAAREVRLTDQDDMMETSRDATPSSPSMSVSARSASASASSSKSTPDGPTEREAKHVGDEAAVEKLLRKVNLEKKMHQLQQRLELASVKATNGWAYMPIKDIEHKLPSTPLRSRRAHLSVQTTSPLGSHQAPLPPSIPYEPPSPSRPWQLTDVLWQPLPPPSRGNYSISPSSPLKRARTDEHSRPLESGRSYPLILASPNDRATSGRSHRRASTSISGQTLDRRILSGPSSPLQPRFENGRGKKRSHSHSVHYRMPYQETTSQDMDAAKALTFMLGGGSEDGGSMSRHHSPSLLPSVETEMLPVPDAFTSAPMSPSQSARQPGQHHSLPRSNLRAQSSHARSRFPSNSERPTKDERPEEDNTAAELMMFLAHSPSPLKSDVKSATEETAQSPTRQTFGVASRVLFTDDGQTKPSPACLDTLPSSTSVPPTGSNTLPSLSHIKTRSKTNLYPQSNLALAPPITPDNDELSSTLVENRV